MKNHLKYVIASLALLTSLGLNSAVRATENAQPVAAQQSSSAQPAVIGPLAWQRVGAPTSLEG
jgi:hypothetical protein